MSLEHAPHGGSSLTAMGRFGLSLTWRKNLKGCPRIEKAKEAISAVTILKDLLYDGVWMERIGEAQRRNSDVVNDINRMLDLAGKIFRTLTCYVKDVGFMFFNLIYSYLVFEA